jgi:hypothetical protein
MKFISPLISQASAKLGGTVFASNRGGNYARAKVAPVQPRTVSQQAVRANLSALSSLWKTLTAAQMAAWNAIAGTITLKDSLGASYMPSGQGLYVGNNRNLQDAGQATISAAPSLVPSFADMVPITPSAAAGAATFVVTTSLSGTPTGQTFVVRATAQISAGKTYIGQSKFRTLGHFAGSSFASLNIESLYIAKFGALVAKTQIGVQVILVDNATGFKSQPATATCIVAT